MKNRHLIPAIALAAFALPVAFSADGKEDSKAAVGEKVPAFSAEALVMIDSAHCGQTTVYAIIGPSCGATPGLAPRIKSLEDTYRPKGVDFVYLYPNKNESEEDKLEFHRKLGLRGGLVNDTGAKITSALNVDHTAAFIVCDKDGKVLFRGGPDDNPRDEKAVKNRYVAQALDEHLAGKPVSIKESRVPG
jgi:hypothetical protein